MDNSVIASIYLQICRGSGRGDYPRRFGAGQCPFFAGFDWDGLLHKRLAPPHIPALSDPFDVANFDPDVEVPGAVLLNLPAEPYPVGDDPWDREF